MNVTRSYWLRRAVCVMTAAMVVLSLPPFRAEAKSNARCLIGVDVTDSALGGQSPVNKWGPGFQRILNECRSAKAITTVMSISSVGSGSADGLTMDFSKTKDDVVFANRAAAKRWFEALTPETAGTTDILSTLSTMSTNVSNLPADTKTRIVLFTDGLQTADYSFVRNAKPDRPYFGKILSMIVTDGALYKFPKASTVEFRGFFARYGTTGGADQKGQAGRLQNLVREFWMNYFSKSGISSNGISFDVGVR